MNKKNRAKLVAELGRCQAGALVRMLSEVETIEFATVIERFLRRAPNGTAVKSNFPRLPRAYKGIPEGTLVRGHRDIDGVITVVVRRGSDAFGCRAWTVYPPTGCIVRGPEAHASGATDALLTTNIVAKEV